MCHLPHADSETYLHGQLRYELPALPYSGGRGGAAQRDSRGDTELTAYAADPHGELGADEPRESAVLGPSREPDRGGPDGAKPGGPTGGRNPDSDQASAA